MLQKMTARRFLSFLFSFYTIGDVKIISYHESRSKKFEIPWGDHLISKHGTSCNPHRPAGWGQKHFF
jgi:hypothetical protein